MLPVYSILNELRESLNQNSTVILSAPPGSGKTTVLPIELLDQPWLQNRKILVLEPRRIAARNSAIQVCQLQNEVIGGKIGYRIRFDQKISKYTKIEYITEGIFIKKISNDPELSDTSIIIFDEFHERNLESDLSLALVEESRKLFRPDLKVMIMSATLNTDELKKAYPYASFISSHGKSFNVDVVHLQTKKEFSGELVFEIINRIHFTDGNILVFLPSVYEIHKLYSYLINKHLSNTTIFTLYGDMKYEDQIKIFIPLENKRKIILSTNISETSITIDNISVVIDSGLRKKLIYDIGSGMNRLITERIALDSADQRKGRAGRTRDGLCFRLWTKEEELYFSKSTQPEILTTDLTNLVLTIKKYGSNVQDLFWINPPLLNSISKAEEILILLGALDIEKKITPLGNLMGEFPLPARLSAMILKSNRFENFKDSILISILLSEKMVQKSDYISTDLAIILDEFKTGNKTHITKSERFHILYEDILNRIPQIPRSGILSLGAILSMGYPDRIGKNREVGKEKFKLSSGKGAYLAVDDPLKNSFFIVAPELDGDLQNSKIYKAVNISKHEIFLLHQNNFKRKESISTNSGDKIKVLQQTFLGEILIEEKEIPIEDGESYLNSILDYLEKTECKDLNWNEPTIDFIQRINFLANLNEKILPIDLEFIKKNPRLWVVNYIINLNRISQFNSLDLTSILKSLMDHSLQKELERDAPEFFLSPAGNRIKIKYTPNEAIVSIKLQELFGCSKSPLIGYGNVRLTFQLLSPAKRPIQITKDLESFWKNTYPEVKKELKSKYPKHPWPDNPHSAKPTAKTTKASLREIS
jgi:ATP-dependent helicase HrpB